MQKEVVDKIEDVPSNPSAEKESVSGSAYWFTAEKEKKAEIEKKNVHGTITVQRMSASGRAPYAWRHCAPHDASRRPHP
jgi:hypothetical protein